MKGTKLNACRSMKIPGGVNAVDWIPKKKVPLFVNLLSRCKGILGTDDAVAAYIGSPDKALTYKAKTLGELSVPNAKKILDGYRKLTAEKEGKDG